MSYHCLHRKIHSDAHVTGRRFKRRKIYQCWNFFKFHPNIIYYSRISHNSANLGMLGVFEKIANNGPKSGQKCLKNSPEGVNRLRMATFGLVCFLHFFYSIAVIRTFGVMHMSHLERSDKKSEGNRP